MNIKYFIWALIILIVLGTGIIFLNQKQKSNNLDSEKIRITTSFYPLYFFASEIGGDKVEVSNITPSGSEPHDYEPTTGDITKIQNSQLLILNGGLEAWGDKIKDNLANKPVKILIAGEGFVNEDPHIWLDPTLAIQETDKITEWVMQIDPQNSGYYRENHKNLILKLQKLDQEYKSGLSNCQTREFVTSHAAFGYLAKAYSLNQISIAGLSPDEEPSGKKLAEVADFAKHKNIKYIFFESLVSPKLSETIASEIGAKTLVLDPIEGLSDDDKEANQNYFTKMENNLINLKIALQCQM